MTSDPVKEGLDRVLTWPRHRQEAAAEMLLAPEVQEDELDHSIKRP